MRNCLSLIAIFIGLACPVGAAEAPAGPPSNRAAAAEAQAKADQELAALCARVVCRKIPRHVTLQMRDKTSFQVDTRKVPYFDDKGAVAIFLVKPSSCPMRLMTQSWSIPLCLRSSIRPDQWICRRPRA